MKRSTNRILTTHTGSLPRPPDLIDMLRARETGQLYDAQAMEKRVREAVSETVRAQADAGVDVVSDGEMGKPGFFQYVRNRLNGLEGVNPQARVNFDQDFPGYNEWRMANRGFAGGQGLMQGRPECIGPLSWKDKAALQADIDNFKAALGGVKVEEAFMPSVSIGIVAARMENRYYPSHEAYCEAIAGVMKDEYKAITDTGFVLQIDAPEMAIDRNLEFRDRPLADFRARLNLWVDALNHALEGIPEEQVRFHICWGNQEAPHTRDIPLSDVADIMLRVHAGAYSVEASNPRHAHEWRVWQDVKLPEGKTLIPGVIDSTTNFVEHPELVADRIETYAKIVGRENVIAGTDCGFGTSANANMVYPPIVYAKLKTMAEGARIATERLWGR
jgi:5-methyltetrahydropteroyltriglutamate--homocysteine methyltransferase